MIVQKFGGTSVEDGAAIERLARIVGRAGGEGPVVVVSAMGTTTDRLVAALARATSGDEGGALDQLAGVSRDTLAAVDEIFGAAAPAVALSPRELAKCETIMDISSSARRPASGEKRWLTLHQVLIQR